MTSPLLSPRSRASDETDRGWTESRVNRSLRRVVMSRGIKVRMDSPHRHPRALADLGDDSRVEEELHSIVFRPNSLGSSKSASSPTLGMSSSTSLSVLRLRRDTSTWRRITRCSASADPVSEDRRRTLSVGKDAEGDYSFTTVGQVRDRHQTSENLVTIPELAACLNYH
jgi:hypothetical protein